VAVETAGAAIAVVETVAETAEHSTEALRITGLI
jgi:hypothetical protein